MNRNVNESKFHTPVLVDEVIEALNFKGGVFVDGTLGGGGHTKAIVSNNQFPISNFQIIGIDRDNEAINEAKRNLKHYSNITFIKDNFVKIDKILHDLKIDKVDAILLDLGVSSHQLDEMNRGFSFKDESRDVSLDMRMDKSGGVMAKDILNSYSRERLGEVFREYGQIGFYKQLASEIVKQRRKNKFKSVGDLLDFLKRKKFDKRLKKGRVHFATDLFRALRIEVNDEIQVIVDVIPKAIKALKKDGRLLIISFHSSEDRIVKHTFKMFAQKDVGQVEVLTKKPTIATQKELSINPRSRSAKLRIVAKL